MRNNRSETMTNHEAPRGSEMVISAAEIAERERTAAIAPYVEAKEGLETASGKALGMIGQNTIVQVEQGIKVIDGEADKPYEAVVKATNFPKNPDGTLAEFEPDTNGDIVTRVDDAVEKYMSDKIGGVDALIAAVHTAAQRARDAVPQMVGDKRAKQLAKHHDTEIGRVNTAKDANMKEIVEGLAEVGKLNEALEAVTETLRNLTATQGNFTVLSGEYGNYRRASSKNMTDIAHEAAERKKLTDARDAFERELKEVRELIEQQEDRIAQETHGDVARLPSDPKLLPQHTAATEHAKRLDIAIEEISERIKPFNDKINALKHGDELIQADAARMLQKLGINRDQFQKIVESFLSKKIDSDKLRKAIEHIPEDNPGREEFFQLFEEYDKTYADFEYKYHKLHKAEDPNQHHGEFLNLMSLARLLYQRHNYFVQQYSTSITVTSTQNVFARTRETIETHHAAGVEAIHQDTAMVVDGENQRREIDAKERDLVGQLSHVKGVYETGLDLARTRRAIYDSTTHASQSTLWTAQKAKQDMRADHGLLVTIDEQIRTTEGEIATCEAELKQLDATRLAQQDPAQVDEAYERTRRDIVVRLNIATERHYALRGSRNARQEYLNSSAANAVVQERSAQAQYTQRQTATRNLAQTLKDISQRGDTELSTTITNILATYNKPLRAAIESGVPMQMAKVMDTERVGREFAVLANKVAPPEKKRRGILGMLGISRPSDSSQMPPRRVSLDAVQRVALTQAVGNDARRKK
jgi:hypothetical protein